MSTCCTKYSDLAKKYMDNTKARTDRSPWDSFIYGVALTMTRRAGDHAEVIKDLKEAFPDVKEARTSCVPPGVPYVAAAEKTYHPDRVVEAMCQNARELPLEEKVDRKVKTVQPSWGHLEYCMDQCDREGIRKHYLFKKQKGPDMLLLESGCQVPVMDRWMNKYWEERITGVPIPLSQDEIEEMVYWATELGPVFSDVVDKICASDPPKLENTHVYRDFQGKDFATKHPTPLTRLLVHLLPNAAEPFWQCKELEELVRTLIQTTAPRGQLLQVCNELARLGCTNASELGKICQN